MAANRVLAWVVGICIIVFSLNLCTGAHAQDSWDVWQYHERFYQHNQAEIENTYAEFQANNLAVLASQQNNKTLFQKINKTLFAQKACYEHNLPGTTPEHSTLICLYQRFENAFERYSLAEMRFVIVKRMYNEKSKKFDCHTMVYNQKNELQKMLRHQDKTENCGEASE